MKPLRAQVQVIAALTIREIQSQQSNLVYGFGWVFFDAILGFAGLLILRLAIRGFNKPGIPVIMFLITGMLPWHLFQATYATPAQAISKNKSLLQLPRVTELDLVLASAVRVFMTSTILFVILAVVDSFYEHVPSPRFPMGIVLLYLSMLCFGVPFGILLMVLNRLYAPASKFVGFFLRFSVLVSGVVFSITMFPPSIWPYLYWNPLLHVEELMRTYWFYSYQTPVGNPVYVAECMFGFLVTGLILERYARRRLPP